jgi:hypothetical protein
MKITQNGALLLAGIAESYKVKREEVPDCRLRALFENPKAGLLEDFLGHSPLETGIVAQLIAFAKTLGKDRIDLEAVILFFGGEEYSKRVRTDIQAKGIKNGMSKALWIFHMLMPVEIAGGSRGLYRGSYLNNGHVVIFKNIRSILCDKNPIELGQMVFVHQGYIVKKAIKFYNSILKAQHDIEGFVDAWMGAKEIDCDKFFPTLLLLGRK